MTTYPLQKLSHGAQNLIEFAENLYAIFGTFRHKGVQVSLPDINNPIRLHESGQRDHCGFHYLLVKN